LVDQRHFGCPARTGVYSLRAVPASGVTADPSALAWTAAFVAWILAVPMWYVTKFAVTAAHEGGHALIAKLSFQTVNKIELYRDGGGGTFTEPPWPITIFVGLAGYLGPSMFGMLGAWLLTRGATDAVLWGSLAFLSIMLLAVRGWFGWLVVPCLMVIIGLVAVKSEGPLRGLFTQVWVWFLLIGGVERMLILALEKPAPDAVRLQGSTLLPAELWTLVFLLGTVVALVYGGGVLVLRPHA
jgi:hypothetical protein